MKFRFNRLWQWWRKRSLRERVAELVRPYGRLPSSSPPLPPAKEEGNGSAGNHQGFEVSEGWPEPLPDGIGIEAPPPPPGAEASEEAEPDLQLNRHARRALKSKLRRKYERARLKFDKFVEPQGPQPVPRPHSPPHPRVPAPPKPYVPTLGDDASLLVDVHHEDRKTKVLYEETELHSQFSFRDTILDQLDRYFFYLNRMKRHDPDSFYLYGQVGGVLVPFVGVPDYWRLGDTDTKEEQRYLSPWFLHTRPTFGCVAYATSSEAEKIEREGDKGKAERWIPKFIYFHKYARNAVPAEIQPVRKAGDIYKMTIWWDRKDTRNKRHKWGKPDDYGIFIDGDGNMRVLKLLEPSWHILPKGGKFSERKWCIPHHQQEYAERHGSNPQRFISNTFVETARRWEEVASVMAKISVRRGEQFACFAVDIHRLPYFFKDRDYVLGPKGTRKPIVHLVRPHVRPDSSVAKFRIRGEQRFTWAGYEVGVTFPGLDHIMWEELGVHVLDGQKAKELKIKDARPMKYLGKLIRDNIETGELED
jgi:hypothetical protein